MSYGVKLPSGEFLFTPVGTWSARRPEWRRNSKGPQYEPGQTVDSYVPGYARYVRSRPALHEELDPDCAVIGARARSRPYHLVVPGEG